MKVARLGDNGNDEAPPVRRGIAGDIRLGAAAFRPIAARATRLAGAQATAPVRLGGRTEGRIPFYQDKDTPTTETRLVP
jgi:microcystin degradation protein MlrC